MTAPEPLMGPGQLNDDQYAPYFRLEGLPLVPACRWCSHTLLIRKGGFVCIACDTPTDGRLDGDDPRLPPEPV